VTLAELLIAVAFLGVCAAVVSDTIMNGIRVTGVVQRRSSAMASAKDAIDKVIDLSHSEDLKPSSEVQPIQLGNGISATRTTTIMEDASLPANVYRLECVVSWTEQTGKAERTDQVSLSTLVRRRDD
jgi:type II secretory pathway pseudopilin PulG